MQQQQQFRFPFGRHGGGGRQPAVAAPDSNHPIAMQSNTNIFVRNLHRSITDTALQNLFSPFGQTVSYAVMRNIHTGDSLGTGFVRFAVPHEAQAALNALNGFVICGRAMILQWAKKQHDSAPAGEQRLRLLKLFVRNIPRDVTQEALSALFSQFGPVVSITLHKDTNPHTNIDGDDGQERRISFVTFGVEGAAAAAADAVHNAQPFESCAGIPLMVKLADDNHQRHGGAKYAAHAGSGAGRAGAHYSKHHPHRSGSVENSSNTANGFSGDSNDASGATRGHFAARSQQLESSTSSSVSKSSTAAGGCAGLGASSDVPHCRRAAQTEAAATLYIPSKSAKEAMGPLAYQQPYTGPSLFGSCSAASKSSGAVVTFKEYRSAVGSPAPTQVTSATPSLLGVGDVECERTPSGVYAAQPVESQLRMAGKWTTAACERRDLTPTDDTQSHDARHCISPFLPQHLMPVEPTTQPTSEEYPPQRNSAVRRGLTGLKGGMAFHPLVWSSMSSWSSQGSSGTQAVTTPVSSQGSYGCRGAEVQQRYRHDPYDSICSKRIVLETM